MKRKVFLAAALFLVLGVMGLHGQQAATQGPEGAVLTGVWHWQNVMPPAMFGPNAVLPSLLTFHNDGTVMCSDSLAFGGLPLAYSPYTYTPFYGVWERTGPHEFIATWLSLRFFRTPGDLAGNLAGIVRARAQFTFADDFDHIAGTIHLDGLACPTPLTCPDPMAPDALWVPFAMGELSFHAARISVVPY
ncbi:MAG: hypothetical protein A2W03_14705 [Candidatus Aminicenantes bacterium RBG_16_63_16]|nr:MAG: hypothetical protein A2W03_14705 [Candidatus Aminicenantes bacterium RBG_16_63_16]